MIVRLLSLGKLFAVACVAALLMSVAAPRALAADDRLQFTRKTLSGAPFNGASLQGNPAVLWFWAPFCPFCNAEAPGVAQVAAANPGVTFVGIAGHSGVGAEQAFVSKYGGLNFTNLNDADGSIRARYNVPWQSAYVFYEVQTAVRYSSTTRPRRCPSRSWPAGSPRCARPRTFRGSRSGRPGLRRRAGGRPQPVRVRDAAGLPAGGARPGPRTAHPLAGVGRAGCHAGMALGFLTVFGLFGVPTMSAATTVQRYVSYATVVIGVVLVALGLSAVRAGADARPLGPHWAPTRQGPRLLGMYGYGISDAIASLPCTVGPFLAVAGRRPAPTGALAT